MRLEDHPGRIAAERAAVVERADAARGRVGELGVVLDAERSVAAATGDDRPVRELAARQAAWTADADSLDGEASRLAEAERVAREHVRASEEYRLRAELARLDDEAVATMRRAAVAVSGALSTFEPLAETVRERRRILDAARAAGVLDEQEAAELARMPCDPFPTMPAALVRLLLLALTGEPVSAGWTLALDGLERDATYVAVKFEGVDAFTPSGEVRPWRP